jgi:hypothetical protein
VISSVNSLATHAVTVLTGQKRATVPVEPVAPIKAVKRRTGHTDDVFKAGNAIGSMIVIASRMEQSSRTVTAGSPDGIDDPGTDTTMAQSGAGAGPLAEWDKAYLEAQEKGRDNEPKPKRRSEPQYTAIL